ncbi:MAG: trans-aconitate 2-methyltransferase [Magnetovibrio sp.]|nr:trans-aconitate 2-methyltransferase [Magnetovibrio sp.]
MATIWDPKQYLKFAAPRLRPALDLLGQVYQSDVKTLYDLGSGTGNLVPFFRDRWPEASIIGVDNSKNMLSAARKAHRDVTWIEADIASWQPDESADLIYSNAALQWLPEHEVLFPKLLGFLKPSGALAIQMPRNHLAPSHSLIEDVIHSNGLVDKLRNAEALLPVLDPEVYYNILSPFVGDLNIWESEFIQILDGDNAVAEWTKGTALKPYLDILSEEERKVFFDQYSTLVARAYPVRPDGKTLFPFRRLFIVARM